MPQWPRDRAADIAKGLDERWLAECSPATATVLMRYDHHVVRVSDRMGVLLTQHLRGIAIDSHSGPLHVQVSFAHPAGHMAAPPHVQELVDQLQFRPWDGSTPP